MTTSTRQCLFCKHYKPIDRKQVCSAFPDGIPLPILFQSKDHTIALPGDHGIRFMARGPAAADSMRRHFPNADGVRKGRV